MNATYVHTQDQSTNSGSTCIHVDVAETTNTLALEPFWSYTRKGPPFSFGVWVSDDHGFWRVWDILSA